MVSEVEIVVAIFRHSCEIAECKQTIRSLCASDKVEWKDSSGKVHLNATSSCSSSSPAKDKLKIRSDWRCDIPIKRVAEGKRQEATKDDDEQEEARKSRGRLIEEDEKGVDIDIKADLKVNPSESHSLHWPNAFRGHLIVLILISSFSLISSLRLPFYIGNLRQGVSAHLEIDRSFVRAAKIDWPSLVNWRSLQLDMRLSMRPALVQMSQLYKKEGRKKTALDAFKLDDNEFDEDENEDEEEPEEEPETEPTEAQDNNVDAKDDKSKVFDTYGLGDLKDKLSDWVNDEDDGEEEEEEEQSEDDEAGGNDYEENEYDQAENEYDEADKYEIDGEENSNDFIDLGRLSGISQANTHNEHSKFQRRWENQVAGENEADYYKKNKYVGRLAREGSLYARQDFEQPNEEIIRRANSPIVNHPNLWMVKCQFRCQKTNTLKLIRKAFAYQTMKEDLGRFQIKSIIAFDPLNGYIFLGAHKQMLISFNCHRDEHQH